MLSALRCAVAVALVALSAHVANALDVPKEKQTKLGLYLSAKDAYDVVTTERSKVLFVDVRTREEVQFLGYAGDIDGHVPLVELSPGGEWDEKGSKLKLDPNPLFGATIAALASKKGLGKADKIVLMCRSGDRSARGVNLLADAGFTNVWSEIEGFEGDLSADGRRTVNGWKNAGLPWTYKLDKSKMAAPSP